MDRLIVKNSIFYAIYNILNILFPLFTNIYVARILLPETIGTVTYAQNIVQYFSTLAFLGIPTYGLREIAKIRNDRNKLDILYSELFFINLFSTILFSLVYYIFIFSILEFKINIALYSLVGLTIILNALNISWLYEGIEKFSFITLRNFIFKIVSFIFLVVFVKQDEDSLFYALVNVIAITGNNIINILYAKKIVKLRFRGINMIQHLKSIFLLLGVNLAIEAYTLVDTTMIGVFCKKDHVAFYFYGNRINKILNQILNTFTIVIVPRLTIYFHKKEKGKFNSTITEGVNIIVLIALPIIVGTYFISEYLITTIFGKCYVSSSYVLNILSLTLILSPLGYLLGSRVLLITGNEQKMLVPVGAGAIVNVIGNYILIQRYDEVGAAITSVISEAVVAYVYIKISKVYYTIERKIWRNLKKIFFATLMEVLTLLLCRLLIDDSLIRFILQIGLSVLVYVTLLYYMQEEFIYSYGKKLFEKLRRN